MTKTEERYHVTTLSHNKKTGPISNFMSESETCPTSCPYLARSECHAKQGNMKLHRDKHDRGEYKSWSFDELLALIPTGIFSKIFRCLVSGDLPGKGDRIDAKRLRKLVKAIDESGKQAIAYTHKPLSGVHKRGDVNMRRANTRAFYRAMSEAENFTVNVSCDSMAELDRAMDRGLDAVVVVPHDTIGKRVTSPGGRQGLVCPAVWSDTQCATCGNGSPLCAQKGRKLFIAFPATGQKRRQMSLNIINQGV